MIRPRERTVLTKNHRQESLSRAFALALGGVAGLSVTLQEGFDYGVDGHFRSIGRNANGRHYPTGTCLDFQLKATTLWTAKRNVIRYDLEADAYNNLVTRSQGRTFILLLLCLPPNEAEWHFCGVDALTLRHACYWFRPVGPEVPNRRTKTIQISQANLLTVDALKLLIAEARAREVAH